MILPTQDYEYPHYGLKEDRDLNYEEKENLLRILKMCDGIILPGGCKIYYYDKFIAKYSLDNDIPILGICLGMQNEKVVEKIDKGVNHKSEEEFAHKIILDKNSKLYDIVKNNEFMINSRHRCNVIKTNKFDIVRIFRR